MNPEAVDVEYMQVRLSDISAGIAVTEVQIRAFYAEELSRDPMLYTTPDQRRARGPQRPLRRVVTSRAPAFRY